MRNLVIHLLFILNLINGLFAHSEPAECAISYFPTVSKSHFQRILPSPDKEGILYGTLLQPPHASMVKAALTTGKHALFQKIYGSFHITAAPVGQTPGNSFTAPALSPAEIISGSRQSKPILIVGSDFAWFKAKGHSPREEKRPVTPEDLGATFLLLTQNKQIPPLGGRDVSQTSPWSLLVTHTGEWLPNISPERMKHRGLTLLSPEGILENGLTWNGKTLDKLPGEELASLSSLIKLGSLWWTQVMSNLTQPSPVKLPANDQTTLLTPNQWQRSRIEPALPYMPAAGGTWTPQSLNKSMTHLAPPGMGGSWRLDIPREGNYEIIFSLNPLDEAPASKRLFKKGEALIQSGNTTARLEIMDGAEEIRIALDLAAGQQYFEVNVTGQGDKDASLSVPYASIRYKGERVTPVIDFQNRTK